MPPTTRPTKAAKDEFPNQADLDALREIQGIEASRDYSVQWFRKNYLPESVLAPQSEGPWILNAAKKDGPPTMYCTVRLPPGVTLRDESRRADLRAVLDQAEVEAPRRGSLHFRTGEGKEEGYVFVRDDGVLGHLRDIAERLGGRLGWSEVDAVAFVLTKRVPPSPPAGILTVGQYPTPFDPPDIITLTVLPQARTEDVARAFHKARQTNALGQATGRHRYKLLEKKHRMMAVFLAEASEADCKEQKLMEDWNSKHGVKWHYVDRLLFHKEAKASYRILTGRDWISPRDEKRSYLARFFGARPTTGDSPGLLMEEWNRAYPYWAYDDPMVFGKEARAALKWFQKRTSESPARGNIGLEPS
jgi:hypothetical protein